MQSNSIEQVAATLVHPDVVNNGIIMQSRSTTHEKEGKLPSPQSSDALARFLVKSPFNEFALLFLQGQDAVFDRIWHEYSMNLAV